MFAINFNFPYRKKDGSLITMEKALDGAGADLDLVDLDDVAITDPADGDILRYNSESSKWENSDALSVAESDIDDIDDEISAICNVYGSKNLLNNEMIDDTSNTIVFTVNADKSFSTSAGTPSGNVIDKYIANGVLFKAGTYRFSGFPDGTNTDPTKVFMEIKTSWSASTRVAELNASQLEDTFTLAEDTVLYIRPYFVAGETLPAMTFYPMITDARIKDRTYVPYAPTNRDCMSYAVNTKLGAHNLLKVSANTNTTNGITFTVNSDKSITVNGTATATTYLDLNIYDRQTFSAGTYTWRGCPAGGSTSTYYTFCRTTDTASAEFGFDTGNGNTFSISASKEVRMFIVIANGATVNNLVFKPMITLASDTDPTYAPHAMTNRELTEVKTVSFTYSNNWEDSYERTRVYRRGTQITAIIGIKKNANVNMGTAEEIISISSSLAPSADVHVVGMTTSGTGVMCFVKIGSDGKIIFNPFSANYTANGTLYAELVWEIGK